MLQSHLLPPSVSLAPGTLDFFPDLICVGALACTACSAQKKHPAFPPSCLHPLTWHIPSRTQPEVLKLQEAFSAIGLLPLGSGSVPTLSAFALALGTSLVWLSWHRVA